MACLCFSQVAKQLRDRGIQFLVVHGCAPGPVLAAARHASCIICDCGYTRILRLWRKKLADESPVAVIEVEGEVVVPAKLLSDKMDSFAAHFRPRLARLLSAYLEDVQTQDVKVASLSLDPFEVLGSKDTIFHDLNAGVEHVLAALDINRSVPRVGRGGGAGDVPLRGGATEAMRHLSLFFAAPSSSTSRPCSTPGREGGSTVSICPSTYAPATPSLPATLTSSSSPAAAGNHAGDRALDGYAAKRIFFQRRTDTHRHTHTCTHLHTYTQTHTHTNTHALTHICMHRRIST